MVFELDRSRNRTENTVTLKEDPRLPLPAPGGDGPGLDGEIANAGYRVPSFFFLNFFHISLLFAVCACLKGEFLEENKPE